MRIEEEIKLDYSDVLFRPKRSTLKSRKDVDLNRKYTFKHSRSSWKGIPIIVPIIEPIIFPLLILISLLSIIKSFGIKGCIIDTNIAKTPSIPHNIKM